MLWQFSLQHFVITCICSSVTRQLCLQQFLATTQNLICRFSAYTLAVFQLSMCCNCCISGALLFGATLRCATNYILISLGYLPHSSFAVDLHANIETHNFNLVLPASWFVEISLLLFANWKYLVWNLKYFQYFFYKNCVTFKI